MHEQQPERPQLSDTQRDRRDFARRDLGNARGAELSDLPESGLVLLISNLIRRLDDCLSLVDELCGETPPDPAGPAVHHP
jgi:hypothetical protein